MITLLFLQLWLAAVACKISDASSIGSAGSQAIGTGGSESGQSHHGKDSASHKDAIHHLARRPLLPVAVDDKLFSGPPALLANSISSRPAETLFSIVEAPEYLLHGWQFHLRMASEPRAPSSVV